MTKINIGINHHQIRIKINERGAAGYGAAKEKREKETIEIYDVTFIKHQKNLMKRNLLGIKSPDSVYFIYNRSVRRKAAICSSCFVSALIGK